MELMVCIVHFQMIEENRKPLFSFITMWIQYILHKTFLATREFQKRFHISEKMSILWLHTTEKTCRPTLIHHTIENPHPYIYQNESSFARHVSTRHNARIQKYCEGETMPMSRRRVSHANIVKISRVVIRNNYINEKPCSVHFFSVSCKTFLTAKYNQ